MGQNSRGSDVTGSIQLSFGPCINTFMVREVPGSAFLIDFPSWPSHPLESEPLSVLAHLNKRYAKQLTRPIASAIQVHACIMDWHVSASRRDWLLLGGCMGFLAVKLLLSVRSSLKEWRDEAEVIPVPPKPQYITQETEDALEQDTLNTLLGHHNYAIRETAAKIVCDRAMNDDSIIETLLVGITRPDYDERMRNLRALAMVTDHSQSAFPTDHYICSQTYHCA